jgi:hypothetical protein
MKYFLDDLCWSLIGELHSSRSPIKALDLVGKYDPGYTCRAG